MHESATAEGARRVTEQAADSPTTAGGGLVVQAKAVCDPGTAARHRSGIHLAETPRHDGQLDGLRDRFLAGGEAGLKSREVEDEDKRRLKSALANGRRELAGRFREWVDGSGQQVWAADV